MTTVLMILQVIELFAILIVLCIGFEVTKKD